MIFIPTLSSPSDLSLPLTMATMPFILPVPIFIQSWLFLVINVQSASMSPSTSDTQGF